MKTQYLLFFLFVTMFSFGQSNCDNANSYLVNAYSHIKNAYKSNNISHLKYYANRSLESFQLSKINLETCDCEIALELTEKSLNLLAKVEHVDTYEDGRFYVKRARDISKESVIEIDKCSVNNYSETSLSNSEHELEALSELEKEQLKLKQQQEALKVKEQQIKTKLAEQKLQELTVKKQQLILSYKHVIASNIEIYNKTLTVCNCNHTELEQNDLTEDISNKSMADIKSYYTQNLQELASNYLMELNTCK